MRRIIMMMSITLMSISVLAGCSGNKEVKVSCTMCNGTGEVKYYYGEGDNDYDIGPCTSCDEKGYIMVVPKGDSNHGIRVVCGSCETYVDELITKEDAAGESRTWCADCWSDYDELTGR